MKTRSGWVSLVFFVGLLFIFVSERLLPSGKLRSVLTGLGLLGVLAATAWRVWRSRRADATRRGVESAFAGLYAIGVSALFLYFAQSDWATRWGGELLQQRWPIGAGVVAVLWPVLLAASIFPTVLMELAYAAMAKAAVVETGRIQDALYSGLGGAFVLVFVFSAMYVASERDVRWDLSYFRTAKPGDATKKVVEALEDDVTVSLFFPPANEVSQQVSVYFDTLKPLSPYLKLEAFDKDLNPTVAKEKGVSSNGTVVFSRGKQRETLLLGQDLEKSRTQLRSLDLEVQKRLLALTRGQKIVYLTQGHGERRKDEVGDKDARAAISLLAGALKAQNYELRDLGLSEGLGNDVPADAAVVMVIGPTEAFQPAEIESLKRYFERGGRMMLALDPEAGINMSNLLDSFGLQFSTQVLANDAVYAVKANQLSDRTILATTTFSSHPAVSTNSRYQFPLLVMGAGALEPLPKTPPNLVIDLTVRADTRTWNDVNGDFLHTPPLETRKAYGLVADVTRRSDKGKNDGRAIVVGDSDVMTDDLLRASRGNGTFVVDALKWLLGEESLVGSTNTEEDKPIARTKDLDSYIFYFTTFLAPALVVALGFLASRRQRGGNS